MLIYPFKFLARRQGPLSQARSHNMVFCKFGTEYFEFLLVKLIDESKGSINLVHLGVCTEYSDE